MEYVVASAVGGLFCFHWLCVRGFWRNAWTSRRDYLTRPFGRFRAKLNGILHCLCDMMDVVKRLSNALMKRRNSCSLISDSLVAEYNL